MLDLSKPLCPWENCGNDNGGGGLLLQAVTTGMLEDQDIGPGGAFVEVEKESTTAPGVRLQCELPSVQPTSAVRVSWNIARCILVSHDSDTVSGLGVMLALAFPDDAIPDIVVNHPSGAVVSYREAVSLPQGAFATSFLWPISALATAPTGRVQLYAKVATADFGDVVRIQTIPISGGSSFGQNVLCLEEVTGIVVQ